MARQVSGCTQLSFCTSLNNKHNLNFQISVSETQSKDRNDQAFEEGKIATGLELNVVL